MQPALVRKRHSNNSLFHPFFKKANHRNGGIFIVRLFDLLVKFIVKQCILYLWRTSAFVSFLRLDAEYSLGQQLANCRH